MRYADAGNLLIFLLFVVASIVSSILQSRKKAQEEREEENRTPLPMPEPRRRVMRTPSGQPAQAPAPTSDWREQLKRMLEGEFPVPPLVPPPIKQRLPRSTQLPNAAPLQPPPRPEVSEGAMVFDSPLRESNTAYKLAAQLDQKVAARLQQIEKQTESARPAPFLRAGSQQEPPVDLARITRSRSSLREAFVASLVFGKPPALDPSHGLPWS